MMRGFIRRRKEGALPLSLQTLSCFRAVVPKCREVLSFVVEDEEVVA